MICTAQNALHIPEILLSINQHLTKSALLSCLRVSRACHAILVPEVWTDISLTAPGSRTPVKQEASLEDLLKHAHLVRTLTLRYASTEDHFGDGWHQVFSRLSHLCIEQQGPDGSIDLPLLESFIQKSKATLVSLHMDQQFASNEVLEALSECQKLKQCRIAHRLLIDDPLLWTSQFERLWSRLEVVSLREPLDGSEYIPLKIHPKDWPTPKVPVGQHPGSRILELTLSNYNNHVYEAQLWILKQCPDLEKLSWYIKGKDIVTPMQQLAEIIKQGESCQRLEELQMKYMGFRNSDFGSLMAAMVRLTVLDLSYSSFNGDSWESIQKESRHLRTLTLLDLRQCGDLPGWAVQEMMCELPNLKVFRASELEDRDVLEDDLPWVCQGLTELSLQLHLRAPKTSFPETSPFSSGKDMMLTRISELTLLEVLKVELIVYRPSEDEWEGSFMDNLTLTARKNMGGGLDTLRTLRRLRVVGQELVMVRSEAEIKWITENWPHLDCPLTDKAGKPLILQKNL